MTKRYRDDRKSVEPLGERSYRATRRLYIAQGLILAITICLLVLSISRSVELENSKAAGLIVASVGICVAAISPLRSVGFGISSIAVSAAQYEESSEKIRPKEIEGNTLPLSVTQVQELRSLVERNRNGNRPIWVLGTSGSGKTTTLEGLLGLNHELAEEDVTWLKSFKSLAYLQQYPGLLNADASDNVSFGRSDFLKNPDKILSDLGLDSLTSKNGERVRDISGEDSGVSGGERQRIGFARTILDSERALIVLDEPTSGLDEQMRNRIWKMVNLEAQKCTVVVATHDPNAPILDEDIKFFPIIEDI